MKRVVIYARVSTEERQQIDALERQIAELTDFVKNNNEWVLTHKYIDEGKSGTTDERRNAYKRLYGDLLTDKFDIVVVKDESRLMRSSLHWQLFKDRLIKNDKLLYFYLERKYFEIKDNLMHDIKVAFAEQYSRDLSTKINNASHHAQKNGTIYGNSRIYGYTKDNGKLIIDEEEAEIVRLIFNLYISGMGFRLIQQELMKRNIYSTTGTPFSLTTMKRIIKQEKYKGVIVSHKTHTDFDKKKVYNLPEEEWVKIYDNERCPAIVATEVWDKANELLKQRCVENGAEDAKKRGAFQGNNYPLSGKIYCAKCGKPYWHEHYVTKVNHLPRDLWQCSTYKAYGVERGCHNQKLMDAKLKELLAEVLHDMQRDSDVKAVVSMVAKTVNNTSNKGIERVKSLKAKISKLEQRKDMLILNLTDGIITREEFAKAKQRTIDDIAVANKELVDIMHNIEGSEDNNRISKIQDFLSTTFDNASEIDDNVLKDVVDRIVVDDKNIDVYLKCYIHQQYLYDVENKEFLCVSSSGQIRTQTEIYKTKKRRTVKRDKNSYLYFFVYI